MFIWLMGFFFVTQISFSQKEFSNWYFGTNAGLSFGEQSTNFLINGETFFATSPASISDAAGNLLFYFGSGTVFNRNHEAMLNGQDIVLGFNSFGSVIIPKPETTNIYYLFTSKFNITDPDEIEVYYSEIDITRDNGLGEVITKNQLLTNNVLAPKLTAVQHANDIDFWLVSHGLNDNKFYSYLINEDGISANPIISEIGSLHPWSGGNIGGALGNIKISHDAKRIAVAFQDFSNENDADGIISKVELMDFNDNTGEVEGNVLSVGENTFFNIPSFETGTGAVEYVEFSPNDRYIYVSAANVFGDGNGNPFPSSLHQFDTNASTNEEFFSSQVKIYSGGDRIWAIQWGIDNKLYVASNNVEDVRDENNTLLSLGIIDNPNNFGLGSNYDHLSVSLSDEVLEERVTNIGLPQDIRQFFFLRINEDPLCGGQARRFTLETSNDILSVFWDFGDGSTSTEINPEHSFSPGDYTVTVTATYEDSIISRIIFVSIPNTLDIPNMLNFCDDISNDNSVTISVDELQDMTLRSDDCGTITFHLTEEDAQNNSNAFQNEFTTTTNPQVIYLRLQQLLNPDNVTITPITISIDDFPTLDNQEYIFCQEEDETISFNNSVFNNLFSGNALCALITYHLTEADANSSTNQLSNEFIFPIGETIVYVRVEDVDVGSFYVATLPVIVKPKPKLQLEDWYYICPNQNLIIEIENEYDGYIWSTGDTSSDVLIEEPGTYTVEVFNTTSTNMCNDVHTFNVGISGLPETLDVVVNDLSTNNSVEVNENGSGDYEYSIDGIVYQDNPIFENLKESEYTLYIRDKNGCGVITESVFLLIQPKFFTPNQDGTNDFWQIKSSFREPDLYVEIFNRYGKLLKVFNGNSIGWDGTFNGLDLPTNDYWFKINRPSNGRVYSGHFTLKR